MDTKTLLKGKRARKNSVWVLSRQLPVLVHVRPFMLTIYPNHRGRKV